MTEVLAKLRGSAYQGLSLAFRLPAEGFYRLIEDKLLRSVISLKEALAWPNLQGTEVMAKLVRQSSSKELNRDFATLKIEHHRLFVGPYRLRAPPYASLYLESEPTVMGVSTVEVLTMYEEGGYFLSPSYKDLPDHITAELEFMALLCEEERRAWKKGDLSGVAKFFALEERFLGGHLVRWIPEFSTRLLASAEGPFYRALASLSRDYVLLDLDSVRAFRRLLNGQVSV